MLKTMRTALAAAIMMAGTVAMSFAAEFDMRFGSYAPEGDVIDRAIKVFMDDVHANSKGRIEITLFRNNTLGSNREVAEMAKAGSVDLFVAGTTHVSRLAPILIAASFPYMFKDTETMFKIVDGEVGKKIAANVAKQGLVILCWWELGVRHVSNNRGPIINPEDIAGLKLRTLPSPVHVAFFKKLGAIPTPMDWAEVMPALQQGVIDGQENPPAVMYPYKVYEFQKYYSMTGHSDDPTIVVMSKATWDKLPPDLQAVVSEAAAKATVLERQYAQEYNKGIMDQLSKVIEINEVPAATLAAFRAAAVSVYPEGYEALDDEGRAIVDAIVEANN